jgi:hypothetical protein
MLYHPIVVGENPSRSEPGMWSIIVIVVVCFGIGAADSAR